MTRVEKWFGLEGTTCVLAGASGLLGAAAAQALRECGAQVIGLDSHGNARAGGQMHFVDLTDAWAVSSFFGRLWAFCAEGKTLGIHQLQLSTDGELGKLQFENFRISDWNKNVEAHLGSAFSFSQEAVRFMKKRRGGSLLNFGSIYGVLGPDLRLYRGTKIKNPVAYAAIKSGIIGLTRYIATSYGADQIRANVICPGGIENGQPDRFIRAYSQKTPLGRMGTPEEIAGAVAFLVGPAAEYISGQVFLVDGGWTAW